MTAPPPDPNPYATPRSVGPGPAGPPPRLSRFTVLAVLNFIFAGLGMIAVLTLVGPTGGGGPGGGAGRMIVPIAAVTSVLLVTAGIGLLRSAKWGWVLMLIYCGVGILTAVYSLISSGQGTALRGAVYPGVALVLLLDRTAREAVGL